MILLSIGSNLSSYLGSRFDNINFAVFFLKKFGIKTIKRSSYFESFSFPNKKDPKFINIIVSVRSHLSPVELMKKLTLIEKILGRTNAKKNKPRTCDIDIIDYKRKVINLKNKNLRLKIPHKKLSYRNFVLFPLKELSPKWKHPKTKEIIGALIRKLPIHDRNSILKVQKNWYN